MPTYRTTLKTFTRRAGKVLENIAGKSDRWKTDDEGNVHTTGVNLNIVERCDLLDLKKSIEQILEDCKDDGY